jgi:hypothetical protein
MLCTPQFGQLSTQHTKLVQDALAQLDQTIEWTHHRQVSTMARTGVTQHARHDLSTPHYITHALSPQLLIQLELGSYQSKKTPSCVEQLLRAAVGSDGTVDVEAGLVAIFDVSVMTIGLHEALSNARKVSRERLGG